MIKEAYVSFEIAKLLKEKGFDEPTLTFYIPFEDGEVKFNIGSNEIHYNTLNEYPWIIAAPTHQMACAWLREVHNIGIEIRRSPNTMMYRCFVYKDTLVKCITDAIIETYEEAVEAALKYSLENLL